LGHVLIARVFPEARQSQTSPPPTNPSPSDDAQVTLGKTHELHKKLFNDSRTHRGSLIERAKREGNIKITQQIGMPFFPSTDGSVPNPGSEKEIACSNDAVVVGVVKSSESFLADNQEWVFTDYVVSIDRILKDNLAHPISPGATIVVARSGGRVQTAEGRFIEIIDRNHPALYAGGKYMLPLKYVPSSTQYQSGGSRGGFRIVGQRAIRLVSEDMPQQTDREYDLGQLAATIRQNACGYLS